MFDYKGRVMKKDDGSCFFYDQDIIFLDYIFKGDCIIDLDIKYPTIGFGILLQEANKLKNPFKSSYSVLYRISDNIFSVEENILSEQKNNTVGTFYTKTELENEYKMHLTFYKKGDKIWLTRTYSDKEQKNQIFGGKVSTCGILSEDLTSYYIGFYGNADISIQKISIATGIPRDWIVNIKNTNGGRVSFNVDSFTIEECEYPADIEQQDILLTPGKYWLTYNKSGNSDIVAYINESLKDKKTEGHLSNRKILLDKTKNILKKDNSFTLKKDTKINIKFSGTKGTISNISINDLRDSTYVSTDDITNECLEGSLIRVDLNKIQSVEWTGKIEKIPPAELNKKLNYSVFNGDKQPNNSIQDVDVYLNEENDYFYKDKIVSVKNAEHEIKGDFLTIFNNVRGEISKLKVKLNHKYYEKEIGLDIINMGTQKEYVPGVLDTPIIVTNPKEEPYDISSSYREIVIPEIKIELFNKFQPICLSNRVDKIHNKIKVYGIPEDTKIDVTATNIADFAESYVEISPADFSFNLETNTISILKIKKSNYAYIAVAYTGADIYYYYFTNWEREFFDLQEKSILQLKKPILSYPYNQIVLYGIKKDEKLWKDYIYRVSDKKLINSIDFFVNKYDLISPEGYTVDATKNRIYLKNSILSDYKYIVIDYLKKDSYSINYLDKEGVYELDISTQNMKSNMLYDITETGSIQNYNLTDIVPNKNSYITASKNEEKK